MVWQHWVGSCVVIYAFLPAFFGHLDGFGLGKGPAHLDRRGVLRLHGEAKKITAWQPCTFSCLRHSPLSKLTGL